MIAAFITGAAGVYFLVVQWELLPVRVAVLAVLLLVIGLLVEL